METKKKLSFKSFFTALISIIIVLSITVVTFGGGFIFLWWQLNFGLTMLQFFLKLLALTIGFMFFAVIFWSIGIMTVKKLLKNEFKRIK